MSTATITSKGQLTIPKNVREALGLVAGDRVTFVKLEDGNFAVVPETKSVMSLRGIIRKPNRPVSIEEMNAAVSAGAIKS